MYRRWTLDEIVALVKGFESGLLPSTDWTHHAHIVVSAWRLLHLSYYDAILQMKLGIPKYNVASGRSNTIDKGYHETLTIFWMWAIHGFIQNQKSKNPESVINDLLVSPFAKKYLPFFFYTEDLLFSPKARVQWVLPNERKLEIEAISKEYPESIWFGDDQF